MQAKSTIKNLDLSSSKFISDPYPTYKTLRGLDKPYWFPIGSNDSENGMWLFSKFEDANTILKETSRTTNNITPFMPEGFSSPLGNTMLQSDPPEHGRRRKLISEYFRQKNLDQLKPRIEKIVDNCIAKVSSDHGMDFMTDFANDIPFILAAESVGIPVEDYSQFFNWSRQLTSGLDYMTNDRDTRQHQLNALNEMHDYFSEWLRDGYQHPQDTITYDLLRIYKSTDMDRAELLSMLALLLIAGHENITATLGNGMLALMRHPEQKTLLANNPQYINLAVEEILRYDSPLQRASLRVVTDEFSIGDYTYNRGDILSVLLGAANHDPAQFENPEQFIITRNPNRHIAFGTGLHVCLGAALGRLQANIVFTRVLKKWPNIRLTDESIQRRHSTLFRSLQSLPVNF